MVELNATINKSIALKTYNQSNTEQLGRYTIKIRHNDKCVNAGLCSARWQSSITQVPDIELLSIIQAMCKTIDNKTTSRKFYLQNRHVADSHNCKPNTDPQAKLDEGTVSKDKTSMSGYPYCSKGKTDMSDYFNSSDNKEADKRVSVAITNRICNEYNDLFFGMGCFEGTFSLQVKWVAIHTKHYQKE